MVINPRDPKFRASCRPWSSYALFWRQPSCICLRSVLPFSLSRCLPLPLGASILLNCLFIRLILCSLVVIANGYHPAETSPERIFRPKSIAFGYRLWQSHISNTDGALRGQNHSPSATLRRKNGVLGVWEFVIRSKTAFYTFSIINVIAVK